MREKLLDKRVRELDLEVARRYNFTKYKKHGELFLLKALTDLYAFRSDAGDVFLFTYEEMKSLKRKVVPLNDKFDIMWYLLERSNKDHNISSSKPVARAMYNRMAPIIKDSTKALKYYSHSVNPTECCKTAKKDCGNRAREVLQKYDLYL